MSQSVNFEFNSLEKIICFQEKTLDILCKITFFITCTKTLQQTGNGHHLIGFYEKDGNKWRPALKSFIYPIAPNALC